MRGTRTRTIRLRARRRRSRLPARPRRRASSTEASRCDKVTASMVEIVESTPRRLVLRKSGRTIQLLLLAGVAMLLIDCVILCFTARTTSLRCARGPAGLTCDVTEKLLGIIPLHSRRIEQVERAVVDSAG